MQVRMPMNPVQTVQGVVRHGRVQLPPTTTLPEGTAVWVWVADQELAPPLLDAHLARRKANGWLVAHVGRAMAQQPALSQRDGQLVWRFKAFLAGHGNNPVEPIGLVDVDAYEGEVLTSMEEAEEMVAHATALITAAQTTNR